MGWLPPLNPLFQRPCGLKTLPKHHDGLFLSRTHSAVVLFSYVHIFPHCYFYFCSICKCYKDEGEGGVWLIWSRSHLVPLNKRSPRYLVPLDKWSPKFVSNWGPQNFFQFFDIFAYNYFLFLHTIPNWKKLIIKIVLFQQNGKKNGDGLKISHHI